MGLVFLLLAGLWGLLALLLRLDRPEPPAADPEAPPGDPAALPAALAVAIGIAVRAHRAVLRKQAAPTMRSHRPGSILFASRWVAAGRHLQTQSWHPRKR
jgi:hypothetical protein